MQNKLAVALLLTASWVVAGTLSFAANTQEVPRMNKEELRGLLGNPDVIVVDVRSERSWDDSNLKIKGAVREDPREVSSWMDKYPKDKVLVFY